VKLLKDILYKAGITEICGNLQIDCASICSDSKDVITGSVFVAVRGTRVDGHLFIPQALQNGAVAIICEDIPQDMIKDITYIKVRDSSFALGQIASNFHNNPSSHLKLIGVSGTNGKTTVATILFHLFRELGYKAGLLSTVCNRINDEVMPATLTTPDPVRLNELLHSMVTKNCTHCFMEVSSHAVVQNRIAGLEFSGGIFTNITHDHLDYHKTFDNYIKAKKSFFDALPSSSFALTNIDDPNGRVMVQNTRAGVHSYSLTNDADFRCSIIENQLSGLHLNIDGAEVWFRLIGKFNAYNLLSIYATSVLLGGDKTDVLKVLSGCEAVEGRFDCFNAPRNITAIVDYAHTPDALKNVLSTIELIRAGNEQIITVIGAGGDRDSAKRPLMARIAVDMSNRVILTSDNPRSEDPEQIIADMKKGIDPANIRKVLSIVNRKEAIRTACALARKGDIILVAGKGHEKYQEIKGVKYPFDDKALLREILFEEY
jgi:UDP-N-acetylmuramoyl-L-alanyl-D-glutamate--2,6-diaminopimelate ligase